MKRRTYAKRSASRSLSRASKKRNATYTSPMVRVSNTPSIRTGQGTKTWVKMLYCDFVEVGGATSGGIARIEFRLNSLFDPNKSSAGHQPAGFNQYETLFEDYLVTECAYKVTFINRGSRTAVVGIYVSDNTSFSGSKTELIEQGCGEWDFIGQETTGCPNKRTFVGVVDLPKLMGLTKRQYITSPDYITSMTADPGDNAFLSVWASDFAAGTASDVTACVELTYTARLTGTRLVPQSV